MTKARPPAPDPGVAHALERLIGRVGGLVQEEFRARGGVGFTLILFDRNDGKLALAASDAGDFEAGAEAACQWLAMVAGLDAEPDAEPEEN